MTNDYQERLHLARALSQTAGELILKIYDSGRLHVRQKALRDPVTEADLQADALIRNEICRHFPTDSILSEESGESSNRSSAEFLWVVDPIDGTVNYSRGLPHCAVSIALVHECEVHAGFVYNPFTRELFHGLKNGGAYLNGKPIHCSTTDKTVNALVATGFPYERTKTQYLATCVQKILDNCQDLRRLGACSLDLCWVACGKIDAYYETVKPWDMAAGALIVREAGGRTGPYRGTANALSAKDLHSDYLLASNAALWESMKKILSAARD